jgi:hypothetical protein
MGRAGIITAVVAVGLASSALAEGGTRWAFPSPPPVRHVDSESSVCVPVTNGAPSQTEFGFDIAFSATAANNVSVAMGADSNGDGDLSFTETEVVVGWDCGRYFLDRPKSGRRYESARYTEPKDRTLSYVCRMAGIGGSLESFRVAVDEGVLGPDGVGDVDDPHLWVPTFTSEGGRHRIRWETTRGFRVWGGNEYSALRDVRLSGGLVATYPSAVVTGGRVAASLFGTMSAYVVYLSSKAFNLGVSGQEVIVWGTIDPPHRSGYGGVYLDVVGSGEVEFTVHVPHSDFTTRVYVDDELVAVYSWLFNSRQRITVGNSRGASVWCWKPGWNMLRITRRGRFRDSGPSGGFTLRQRGGIIQLH